MIARLIVIAVGVLAVLWFMGWPPFRSRARREGGMPVDEARRVLGVGPNASEAEIIAAHRQQIAATHPDKGGNDAVSSRVNVARDVLLQQLRSPGR